MRHGTRSAYLHNHCRCPDAVAANTAYRAAARAGTLTPVNVPAVGATRRLRALALLGWSCVELSRRTGVHRSVLSKIRRGQRTAIAPATDKAITAAAEGLWQQRPAETPATAATRAEAEALGWAPFIAWDDIDDPDELPQHLATPAGAEPPDSVEVDRLLSGAMPGASHLVSAEVVAHLAGRLSDREIGRRLAVSPTLVGRLRKAPAAPVRSTQPAGQPLTAGAAA